MARVTLLCYKLPHKTLIARAPPDRQSPPTGTRRPVASSERRATTTTPRVLKNSPGLVGNDRIFDLVEFWHEYMKFASERPGHIEWPIMNECFENLPSDEMRMVFASPTRLAGFAARLVE